MSRAKLLNLNFLLFILIRIQIVPYIFMLEHFDCNVPRRVCLDLGVLY